MTDICKERWFQIVERLSRPLSRWFFAAIAVAYGVRAVIGLDFDEVVFVALCAPVGLTYVARGVEKYKEAKQ